MTRRIHLLALPNAQTTHQYSLDGFSAMTIRIAELLTNLGQHVTLYASEENDAPCAELVTCITKAEQQTIIGDAAYQNAVIHPDNPLWAMANPRMIAAIQARKQPRDLIFTIGGYSQKPITDAHPDLMDVEYQIGYVGNYARYRVFQSRVWQHLCYGAQGLGEGIRFYDTHIPGFVKLEDHPCVATPEPYVAYCGRLVPKKGLYIACEAARRANVPLKIVGHGDKSLISYGDYLGPLDNAARNEVLAHAAAVLCPTTYVEPFNCVAIEAQMSGTPVISTDQGGFVETVDHLRTGYRCSMLSEFVEAVNLCREGALDRAGIRQRAERLYSLDAAQSSYRDYLARLDTIWGAGWYSE